jgi:hypothetical protein
LEARSQRIPWRSAVPRFLCLARPKGITTFSLKGSARTAPPDSAALLDGAPDHVKKEQQLFNVVCIHTLHSFLSAPTCLGAAGLLFNVVRIHPQYSFPRAAEHTNIRAAFRAATYTTELPIVRAAAGLGAARLFLYVVRTHPQDSFLAPAACLGAEGSVR